MFAFVPWILISADVIPRPPVEASLLDVSDVVGRSVVAQLVALIDRGPEQPRLRIDRDPYWIANARCIHTQASAVRIGFQDIRTMDFNRVVISVIDVRMRTDRDVHFAAVARKRDVARAVTSAAESPATGQVW